MAAKRDFSCDIFCAVIDNYGDAGVCWRLARQLSAEYGIKVRLWIDDPAALAPLDPAIDPHCEEQFVAGVLLQLWRHPFPPAAPAQVVIEAFGCRLPETYLAAMARQPPIWLNLEYLSAEAWVDSHHGLPSPHPQLPLIKYFFIPGFSEQSGGLLREENLLSEREQWRPDWAPFGLAPPRADEFVVSVFCYENPAFPELLQTWSTGSANSYCLLAPGPAQSVAAGWLGKALQTYDSLQHARLRLTALPFYAQDIYDRLLWSCDLNFVRGEDSFVRAQWAKRPLLWQAYRQEQNAHLPKLDAFLAAYCADLSEEAASAYRDFAHAWNGAPESVSIATGWTRLMAERESLSVHARQWANELGSCEHLVKRLVKFLDQLL